MKIYIYIYIIAQFKNNIKLINTNKYLYMSEKRKKFSFRF